MCLQHGREAAFCSRMSPAQSGGGGGMARTAARVPKQDPSRMRRSNTSLFLFRFKKAVGVFGFTRLLFQARMQRGAVRPQEIVREISAF